MADAQPSSVVILAAGQGTRMRSSLHKVLHQAAGRPLLGHVLRAARALNPERIVVVVGHDAEQVRAAYPDDDLVFVEQTQQLGTGHAFLCARSALDGVAGSIVVLYGDQPLTAASTLKALVAEQGQHGGAVLLTYEVEQPHGLGRVLRAADGAIQGIREEKDANAQERALHEIWPGVLAFDPGAFTLAEALTNDNASGEYYLTQIVDLYRKAGRPVRALRGDDDMSLLVGVNTRTELARAEALLHRRVREHWLERGVTMRAPDTTFIDDTVQLARDVTLEPGVLLRGATRLGEGAQVGAYAVLDDCVVAPGATVPAHTVASNRSFD